MRSVLRTLGELGVLRCRELAFKAVKQPVQNETLPVVQTDILNSLPETSLGKNSAKARLRSVNGASQAAEKPIHPRGNIHRPLLRLFQNVVIGIAVLPDLRGHAVEALRTPFGARECQVGNGTCNSPVAIGKGMYGYEP